MPHSLRVKIKGLRYKGIITEKDCDRLCKALDNEGVLDKIRAEITEKYWDCDICKWKIDYKPHYNIRGDINDILQIIDKYRAESEE